jgi:hypothetical protein
MLLFFLINYNCYASQFLKSCKCYYSMSFLWQCLKIISAKYLTETSTLSLFLSICLSVCLPDSVSLSISLSACLSISLLKPEPVMPELLKFGPAELGPKARPVRARACSLISKSQSPTFRLGLRPDPALVFSTRFSATS